MHGLWSGLALRELKLELVEKASHDQLDFGNGKLPARACLVAIAKGQVVGMGHSDLVQVPLVGGRHALAITAHGVKLRRIVEHVGVHGVLIVGKCKSGPSWNNRAILELDVLVCQPLWVD